MNSQQEEEGRTFMSITTDRRNAGNSKVERIARESSSLEEGNDEGSQATVDVETELVPLRERRESRDIYFVASSRQSLALIPCDTQYDVEAVDRLQEAMDRNDGERRTVNSSIREIRGTPNEHDSIRIDSSLDGSQVDFSRDLVDGNVMNLNLEISGCFVECCVS